MAGRRSESPGGAAGPGPRAGWALVVALAVALGPAPARAQQLPGLPGLSKPATAPKADPSQKPLPTKGAPGAIFSATSGPIKVNQKVDDGAIAATLDDLLGQFPGVRRVESAVHDGAVKLEGHVDDESTLNDVTAFSQKVEGVRLVLNKMKTDAEVLTGPEMAAKVLREYRDVLAKNWLLAIVAVAFMFGFAGLARAFARYSETLLSPFLRNSLLRSVVGSILSTVIVLAGILLGLSVLNLTHAVLSVLGLAGVAGLALGFAFRDIAENFIASMLLGVRRPFGIGDFITVAGKSGSVLSLDTRATLLITPEGNHVRIPNAVIYKEILTNASTTPTALGTVDVLIPYETSTADALEGIAEAMSSTEGLVQDPKPRALIQALEVNGVRIRASYWLPTKGIDGDKVQSDLRLKIKVALQKAGFTPPSAHASVAISGRVPVELFEPRRRDGAADAAGRPDPDAVARPGATASTAQIEDNLRKDSRAADAAAQPDDYQDTPIDHAIKQAEVAAKTEGGNMLVNGKS